MKAGVLVVIPPNASVNFIKKCLGSVKSNIGIDDYRLFLSVSDDVDSKIDSFIERTFDEDRIERVPFHQYWADVANEAIDLAAEADCDYFVTLHDDVWITSENFLPRVDQHLDDVTEPVGWITFTDEGFLHGQPDTPPARPGFHEDYFEHETRRRMYQFHTLEEGWWKPPLSQWLLFRLRNKLQRTLGRDLSPPPTRSSHYYESLPYDMPEEPVKCHAPWTHLMIIKMDRLWQIGYAEHWETENTLLLDEDWGLRALEEGLFNMWIPTMGYVHGERGRTRSSDIIYEHRERVHNLFKEKWGYPVDIEESHLDYVESEYAGTNIPWSIGRKSYEWNYFG